MSIKNLQFYSEQFLKILTKSNELLPFCFNNEQKIVDNTINSLKKDNTPVRLIILKARQLGISTYFTSNIYHQAATNFYVKSQVVADDEENTANLFNMCKRYHQFSPEIIRPMKRYSNKKALVFENPDEKQRETNPGLLSSVTLQTSNKVTAGRSGTVTHLHLSEFAFWANAGLTVTGLMQSVPYKPGTSICIESTANGVAGRGEEFFKRWQAAKSGDSDFIPIFFPWFDNPEYEIDPGEGFKLDHLEKDLMDMYPVLTERKMAWRRYKIANEMGSALMRPEEQFMQEYPSCPDEAFIKSGRTVFDNANIVKMINDLKSVTFTTWEL